ncbi:putative metal-binding motif-containing protein [Archangium sp.]|uniref:putative metal-binding motif-containing protein n=1 Tax=Archangium sp. TaxID=1872627 RepID=UPI002ED927C3
MPPTVRRVRAALLALGACTAVALACYEVPTVRDYYTCAEDAECGDGGFVCDDGVCCREREAPVCIGRVLDGGTCLDGGTPTLFFEDLDEDSFGNLTRPLYRCTVPQSVPTATNSGDCNDNPTAGGRLFFPGAPEQCDGFDNDCDGVIDDGLDGGSYYPDQDNDTFGDTSQATVFCQPPAGWVASLGDCKPRNGAIHPNAEERCNGVDDNCNDLIDENVQPTWYRDQDRDGFGRKELSQQSCTQPGGYVSNALDCRDDDANKHPDAPDLCNGVDDDCDQRVDERPDCGGPLNLLDLASTGARGALNARRGYSGAPPGCLKDVDGGIPESFSAANVWSANGPSTHVLWFEASGTWDLTRSPNALGMAFTHTMSGNPEGISAWSPHWQPVVMLCSDTGFTRYVPRMDAGTSHPPLLPYGGAPVDTSVAIGQGNVGGWVEVNSNLDLRHVKRVEILLQPNDAGTSSISFNARFSKLGFQ